MNGKPRETSSREKTEAAAEFLLKWPESSYRAASAFIDKYGCTRRTAQNFLARARKELAARHPTVMRDLDVAIAHNYAEGVRRALANNDLRSLSRLLDGARKLVSEIDAAPERDAPTGIDFVVVDAPGQQHGGDPGAPNETGDGR